MSLFNMLSGRRRSVTADTVDCWETSASELGLASEPAAAEVADPAAGAAGADKSAGDVDDKAATAGADSAEEVHGEVDSDDDEQDQDPLDVLTEREDDEQDSAQARANQTPREKALSKRARKLERQLKKHLPTVQALRAAGLDLPTLLNRHTALTNLEAAIERSPRLRALLEGNDEDVQAGRETRRPAGRDDEAEERYPFDPEDEVGRWMTGFHKSVKTQQGEIADRLERIEKSLGTRLERIEGATVRQHHATVEHQWKTATDAASAKLDKGVRNIFADAVHAAMREVISGRLKATPQQIIDHYLKGLNVSNQQKDRASAASAQRIAERNKHLPRRPETGRGSPASPQSRTTPRLESFNRDIQRRFGAA